MMNWQQIVSSTYNQKYPRAVEDEIEYQWHKSITAEISGGLENYIKKLYVDSLEPYIFIKNRFGYNVESDVKHYLLWINPKHQISVDNVIQIIRERFPTQEVFFRLNPVQFRSIMGVLHYHVFIRI